MKSVLRLLTLVLSMLSNLDAISIDGQLTVIRNDCYERMSIGEKLSPKQTYKSFDHNTVSKCELECTQEKETCRAYSFGIGPKGNGTCLLGRTPVQETADLKPIGTISDTDYDLYIKKLDCHVVLQQPTSQAPVDKPLESSGDPPVNGNQHQHVYGVQEHHNGPDEQPGHYGNIPAQSNYHSSVSNPTQDATAGYHYDKPNNMSPAPTGHRQGDEVHQVQTLVSIASGPQNVLHPVHDILISGESYEQGKPPGNGYEEQSGGIPPFRPSVLNNPYDDTRSQPSLHGPEKPSSYGHDASNRPNVDYGGVRPSVGYEYGYGSYGNEYFSGNKPLGPYSNHLDRPKSYWSNFNSDRPDPSFGPRPSRFPDYEYGDSGTQVNTDRRKYESFNQFNSYESEAHRYGSEHTKPYAPNYNFYDHYQKPNSDFPSRYGSVVPHPNEYYNRPGHHHDYLFVRPNSDTQNKPVSEPSSGYDRPNRLWRPGSEYNEPNGYFNSRPRPDYDEQISDRPSDSDGSDGHYKPSRPNPNSNKRPLTTFYSTKKPDGVSTSSCRPASTELSNHYGGVDYVHSKPGEYHSDKSDTGNRKIVTESIGYNGEKITSIITELENACFRRTMAGKRVVRGLVRKLLVCDTVEQCQQECGDEMRFTCEGFNYRLDPSGRGKGECELLDLPLTRIDITRELVSDPDYDFYTRDRNAAQVNCRQPPGKDYFPVPGEGYGAEGYRYGYDGERDGGNRRGDGPNPFDRQPTDIGRPLRRPGDRWDEDYGNPRPRPRPPPIDPGYPFENNPRNDYGNRRGDYSFHHSHDSHSSHSHSYHYNEHNVDRNDIHRHEEQRPYSGIHYLPASPDRSPSYDRYSPPKRYPLDSKYPSQPLPPRYPPDRYNKPNRYPSERYPPDRLPEKDYWGLDRESYGGRYGDRYNRYENNRRNYYIPSRPQKPDIPEDWGLYGGSYGTGSINLEYQGYGNRHNYNYWGFNKFQDRERPVGYDSGIFPARKPGSYLPEVKPHPDGSYLPLPRPHYGGGGGYIPQIPGTYDLDNNIIPAEPRRPPGFNFIRDECSLRSATGYRLHKRIVKKLFFVPNIYECELLCVKEKDFPCASYAFRYTVNSKAILDNCYLSSRNYKELDNYTDLEPDRDFDIYTMNNRQKCEEPVVFSGREDSDCFWRVRSGQRLDHSVVRDSLSVKSIVDCQLECLKSRRFTCRAYSFRYGSPIIGGAIDNCQLTDWPFYELDPRKDFIPEREFEVYERGSYGHGCEPNHFQIRGKYPVRDNEIKVDQLCYIGFGSAAKLLPQATIKSFYVPTELDCKTECSKAREGTLLKCMSFSFITGGPKVGHNCFLSDIMQRDLLPNVDYIHDPDSWLFTWDNYNPECINLANKPIHDEQSFRGFESDEKYSQGHGNALDVWRVYSVSGWPCRRGMMCKKNWVAGFWYCELEGGEHDAWDYCCNPDHQCGFSHGYSYSWCYVGPSKTQWRKCNDQYYPYIHNAIDRFDGNKRPWHPSGHYSPRPQIYGHRPDRPNAPVRPKPARPSLDEYEQEFDNEFLSPPKPGGFGQPRRWPVAYLHKETPPNVTENDMRQTRTENSKLSAIKSLIDVIQNTEIQNVQYHISNDSSKIDDILYVKIPLPSLNDQPENATTKRPEQKSNELSSNTKVNFEMVDTAHEQSSRVQKSLPTNNQAAKQSDTELVPGGHRRFVVEYLNENRNQLPTFRRGFVTRTNLTSNRLYRSF